MIGIMHLMYSQKKACDAEEKIVGHLLMEVSRITNFLMDCGARLTATLRTTYYRIPSHAGWP